MSQVLLYDILIPESIIWNNYIYKGLNIIQILTSGIFWILLNLIVFTQVRNFLNN